jgi:hypothetical protein
VGVWGGIAARAHVIEWRAQHKLGAPGKEVVLKRNVLQVAKSWCGFRDRRNW